MEPSKPLDLERELTCSICTEILYQPLTLLDCLHTFCGSCLKEWFDHVSSKALSAPHASAPVFTCPACRSLVRDTGHNATINTLLDMFLVANPGRGRTHAERVGIATRYKPGDLVLPRVPASAQRGRDRESGRDRERRRRAADESEAERQLVEEVQDMSLRDATEPAGRRRDASVGAGGRSQAADSRDRGRERGRERDRDGRQALVRQAEDRATRERRRRDYDESRHVEHQSSLRSLLGVTEMSERDIEREILEFAHQIQEEGLLDGLDLDNIDLTRDDDLSSKIREAYRRRLRERAGRRSLATSGSDRPPITSHDSEQQVGSSMSHHAVSSSTRPSRSQARGQRRSTSTNRTDRTHHSRSASTTSQTLVADDHAQPSTAVSSPSQLLEVYSSPDKRRRRRAQSGGGGGGGGGGTGRSATVPALSVQAAPRLEVRSQTNLHEMPQDQPGNGPPNEPNENTASSRPAPSITSTIGANRSSSSPSVSTTTSPIAADNPPPPSASFAARAGNVSFALDPHDAQSLPSPRMQRSHRPTDLSIISLAVPPTSSSSRSSPKRNPPAQLFQEPNISCSACHREHIEYDLHYNCAACNNGEWNLCLDCYRAAKGCANWYGFGHSAWPKWERTRQAAGAADDATYPRPHVLTANRYLAPKATPGGADGRRTLTPEDPLKRLQSGNFCSRCLVWSNDCWWRCDRCNEGEWGFCNSCVNQGNSCSHPLLPLTYEPPAQPHLTPPASPSRPPAASVFTGPGAMAIGPFKPLTFTTRCDLCQDPIVPLQPRHHCYSCTSTLVSDAEPGDYDVCTGCYDSLLAQGLVSRENGMPGWRRCLRGHRMVMVAFRHGKVGQWRHVVRDLIGGRGLRTENAGPAADGVELQRWSWYTGGCRTARLVTRFDVARSAPEAADSATSFPREGGTGAKALATWSWHSSADGDLKFPKGAEVVDIEDVNGEWWYGVYMGNEGLFPAPYVRVIDGEVFRVNGEDHHA